METQLSKLDEPTQGKINLVEAKLSQRPNAEGLEYEQVIGYFLSNFGEVHRIDKVLNLRNRYAVINDYLTTRGGVSKDLPRNYPLWALEKYGALMLMSPEWPLTAELERFKKELPESGKLDPKKGKEEVYTVTRYVDEQLEESVEDGLFSVDYNEDHSALRAVNFSGAMDDLQRAGRNADILRPTIAETLEIIMHRKQ